MCLETLVFNPLSTANYTICSMVLRITSRNIYLYAYTYICTSIRQSRCVTKSILCTRSSCNAIFYHTKSQLTIAQPLKSKHIHKGIRYRPLFWNVSMNVAHDAYRGHCYTWLYAIHKASNTIHIISPYSRTEFDGKSCYINPQSSTSTNTLLLRGAHYNITSIGILT